PAEGEGGGRGPPFVDDRPGMERSLAFLHRNAGKRSVVLDLAQRHDRDRLDGLLADADIFLENLGPDGHGRHDLAPAAVSGRHPQLIVASISDFGLWGPRAVWR